MASVLALNIFPRGAAPDALVASEPSPTIDLLTHHAGADTSCGRVHVDGDSSNPAADTAMARYAIGDDAAFVEVYRAVCPRLYSFILRKVRDRSRAEDIVQQTMLQIHCARGRFLPGSRATPWVFSIATRLFLDHAKRKKVEILSTGCDDTHERPSDRPSPEAFIASKELEAIVRAEVERLSPPQREAFELVHYGQMSHAEAAEVLGVTVTTVKLRMQRANQIVRAALQLAGRMDGSP